MLKLVDGIQAETGYMHRLKISSPKYLAITKEEKVSL